METKTAEIMDSSPDATRLGKRKQSTEDARGPAWGAQSFSANKNNAINKAMRDSGKDPGFGDFGRYFSEKKRKLRDQYQDDATASFVRELPAGTGASHVVTQMDNKLSENSDSGEANKHLFKGVSIFVDGFTTPTHQELRFLMMKHGGIFENYFSSQRVTHIICSTLPDSKIMNPRLMSRGLPIVKPEWIVDSIKENRLLSWASYQLERIAYSHPHQRTLSGSFSTCKLNDTSLVSRKAVGMVTSIPVDLDKVSMVNVENEVAFPAADTVSEPDERVETSLLESERGKTLKEEAEDQGVPLPTINKLHEEGRIEPELTYDTDRGIMPNKEVLDATAELKQTKQKVATGRGHSTLDDPNFVQSYFKYSRLHFIGTWRNRYQSLVNAGSFGKPDQGFRTDRTLALPSSSGKPVIIHLDMDCFFVSVVVRNRPDLVGKPVAVCHSDSVKGTGEISSANYPARSYGIKAGMFVRDAKARCPELAIVPYDFAAYEQATHPFNATCIPHTMFTCEEEKYSFRNMHDGVADIVYSILHSHCSVVQAVSCDEAFLDVTGHSDPANLASRIREEIFQATQCTASAGIAENLLLARLATKKAKPNGQYFIHPDEVKEFMAALPLDQLPGVGWNLREKLHGHGLYMCADLQSVSKEALQKDYGTKTGVMLWSYAQGIDEREVKPAQERKSIGAEVNWGVRFSCMDDAQQFLVTLSNEVASRMREASASGRTITLKVKRRKEGYGEPVKFMGCGVCDNLSRSETVGYATNSAEILLRVSRQLFASLYLDVQEVRGVGLHVSRLESANTDALKQHNALDSWLAPPTKVDTEKSVTNQVIENNQSRPGAEAENNFICIDAAHFTLSKETDAAEDQEDRQHVNSDLQLPVMPGRQAPNDVQMHNQTIMESKKETRSYSLELPPLSQLDQSVLEFLPEDIVAEIIHANKAEEELKQREYLHGKVDLQPRAILGAQRPAGGQLQSQTRKSKTKPRNSLLELPPRSQLDLSVLESLPEDILAEINHAYEQELRQRPSRRESSRPPSNLEAVTSGDKSSLKEKTPTNVICVVDGRSGSNNSIDLSENISSKLKSTAGHAVHFGQLESLENTKYEDYHTLLQNILACVNSGQSQRKLSSGFFSLGCYLPTDGSRDITGLEEIIHQCFGLLMQYVQSIAHKDLEEVHLVLQYIKRLGSRCKFWRAVQELAIPAVKAVVGELYGGHLNIA